MTYILTIRKVVRTATKFHDFLPVVLFVLTLAMHVKTIRQTLPRKRHYYRTVCSRNKSQEVTFASPNFSRTNNPPCTPSPRTPPPPFRKARNNSREEHWNSRHEKNQSSKEKKGIVASAKFEYLLRCITGISMFRQFPRHYIRSE